MSGDIEEEEEEEDVIFKGNIYVLVFGEQGFCIVRIFTLKVRASRIPSPVPKKQTAEQGNILKSCLLFFFAGI